VTSALIPEHGAVLFIGDHITDGDPARASPGSPGGGHAATAAADNTAEHPRERPDSVVDPGAAAGGTAR
jgi:hypothetical protein